MGKLPDWVVYFSFSASTKSHNRRGEIGQGLDIIGSLVPVGGVPRQTAAQLNSRQLSAEQKTFILIIFSLNSATDSAEEQLSTEQKYYYLSLNSASDSAAEQLSAA